MKKYAKIEDGKIAKFKIVPDDDAVIVPKLLAHGYLIVEEETLPAFDWVTQTLIDDYEIQAERVLRVWAVEERPFVEAQQAKKSQVELEALDNIKLVFDEADQQTKVGGVLTKKDSTNILIAAAKNNVELRAINVGWKAKAVEVK